MSLQLPDGCHLVESDPEYGGLTALRVTTSAAEVVVLLHGAHLCHWQPAGDRPVLWLSGQSQFSADAPVRGGVPICFPWFGPGRSGDQQPAHGWARLARWTLRRVEVADDGTATIELALTAADVAARPGADEMGDFTVVSTVVAGAALDVSLHLTAGDTALDVEQALHTYIGIDDVRHASVEGLDGVGYLDKVNGEHAVQHGPVTFTAETDRVYDAATPVTLHADRTIVVEPRGAAQTVVWNPWITKAASMPDFGDDEWTSMVCIESATVLERAVHLEPGESHTLGATYRLL